MPSDSPGWNCEIATEWHELISALDALLICPGSSGDLEFTSILLAFQDHEQIQVDPSIAYFYQHLPTLFHPMLCKKHIKTYLNYVRFRLWLSSPPRAPAANSGSPRRCDPRPARPRWWPPDPTRSNRSRLRWNTLKHRQIDNKETIKRWL